MKIKVLASGSSGNAYVIEHGGSQFLLECGLSVRRLKKATNFGLSGMDFCLVTHEHGDHAKAAADLMKAGIDVYMSQGTAGELGLSGHRLKIVRAQEIFSVGEWVIKPFESIHDAAEPLNYLIANGGEKLVYLTDTAYCPYLFTGLTRIMIEANHDWDILREKDIHPALKKRVMRSHMSIDTVLGFFRANDLSQVQEIWLLHLSENNSDEEQFKREIQAITGKPVYIA